MIGDGIHNYQFDPDNQITTVDGTAATYTYGPDGQRVRKQAGGLSTEYLHFNGEVLAEWNGAADWSDYIFDAAGKRIARGDSYEDRLLVQETNCANCGWQYTFAICTAAPALPWLDMSSRRETSCWCASISLRGCRAGWAFYSPTIPIRGIMQPTRVFSSGPPIDGEDSQKYDTKLASY